MPSGSGRQVVYVPQSLRPPTPNYNRTSSVFSPRATRPLSTATRVSFSRATPTRTTVKTKVPKKTPSPTSTVYVYAPQTKSKSRMGSLTTGMSSLKVSAKKKRVASVFNVKGSVLKVENGGVHDVSSINANYIGHSIATNQVCKAMCRALVKSLYIQAGISFTNWNDGVPYNGKIGIYYVIDPASASTISGFEVSITAGETFITVANAVLSNIQATFSLGVSHEFHRFYLTDNSNTTAVQVAQMMAKQFYIDFSFTSRLAVQNRTLAQNADDNADDITNNPLVGKIYTKNKHWANFVTPNDRTTPGDMVGKYVANKDTGLLLIKSSDTNVQGIRKPPPCWFFDMSHESKIKCAPGQILNNYLTFKCMMSWNAMYKKLLEPFADNSSNDSDFGNVSMFGLEKLLDSHRNTGSTISLGYEINQTYSCAPIYKKYVASTPILEIGTSQITSS